MKPFNQWERELAEAIRLKGESAPIEFGSIPETGVTPEYVAPIAINPRHEHSLELDPRGSIFYRGPSREEERLQEWEADLQRRERLLLDQSKLIDQISYLVSQLHGVSVCQRPQSQEGENITATEAMQRHRAEEKRVRLALQYNMGMSTLSASFGQDMTASELLRRHRELGFNPYTISVRKNQLRANEQAGDDDEPTGNDCDGE